MIVIDSNDHRPKFSKTVYTVDISENVDIGTEILELNASDEDEDDKVFYSLHAARSPSSFDVFRIDSVTGAVTLATSLDRSVISLSPLHVRLISLETQVHATKILELNFIPLINYT